MQAQRLLLANRGEIAIQLMRAAREMAEAAGVPVIPGTGPLPDVADVIHDHVRRNGLSVTRKASRGGGQAA